MDQVGKARAPMEAGKAYINPGEEDQMEIAGYCLSRLRNILTWIGIVLTLGFLRLVFYWKPEWMLRCTHLPCSLAEAEKVLLQDEYHQWFVETVKMMTHDGTRVVIDTKTKTRRVQILRKAATYSRRHPEPSEDVSAVNLDVSPSRRQQNVDMDTNTGLPLLKQYDESLIRYFNNKKMKYIWDQTTMSFRKFRGLEANHSCSYFHEAKPLTAQAQEKQRVLHGLNAITVHVTPIITILFTQVLNPFYVFQVFSMILWYNDEYYYYATCILFISIFSLSIFVYQTRRMQRALKSTVTAHSIIPVCSGDTDEFIELPTDMLVPGDVIEVPRHGCTMQCDAVLISGNCIVNESMLTGESVPVTKTPLPNPKVSSRRNAGRDVMFNMRDHSRHVLFCGTRVIQTRYYGSQKVRAVVIRTGFSTAKGELVRSIMFPKPVDFKFSQDAFKFIGLLALVACIGMVYTLVLMISNDSEPGKIVLRTLDLITIVIPPALPAAMTVGIVFAQNRLKAYKVFCISPRSINLCGAINVICFDKTGTLTEDGLDMWGILPVTANMFQNVVHSALELGRGTLVSAMATCHSLTIIEGAISGDPLDLKMFEATGWDLEEPGEDTTRFDVIMPTTVRPKTPDLVRTSENFSTEENLPYEIGILRQFTFSSRLQRMSVIARTLGSDHFDLYAKGAPEMIASLSKPETVPVDFQDVLMRYTQQGFRVIALAWRPLHKLSYVKVQRAQREQVECDLEFLGLLVMENRLKPESTPTIRDLSEAAIRTVMVTGDNMLTALSVARDCGMIRQDGRVLLAHVVPPTDDQPARMEWTGTDDLRSKWDGDTSPTEKVGPVDLLKKQRVHFAVTGKSWELVRRHFPDLLPKLVVRGTVFARMSPDQKMQLIEMLQEVGYYVGMCGDGANDCGALKTAHAGISLSDAEASVASPFTSKEPNISCVPTVIREGRAALVTSFGIFKYMACYSLTQFTTVCILYWIRANLTDFQFLYIDLFLLTSLCITYGYTHGYRQLSRHPPPVSLISFAPIISILLQMLIVMAVQIFVWLYTRQQPWFEAYVHNDEDDYACHAVTTLFAVSSFQYITLVIIFSKGAPYRKTIFSNYYFLVNLAVCIVVTIYSVLYPFQWYHDLLELQLPPSIPFRLLVIGIALVNFFACFILETFFLDNEVIKSKCENLRERIKPRKLLPHEQVEKELSENPHWPPDSSSTPLADILRLESAAQTTTGDAKLSYADESTGRIRTLSTMSSVSGGSSDGRNLMENVNRSYEPDVKPSEVTLEGQFDKRSPDKDMLTREDSQAPLVAHEVSGSGSAGNADLNLTTAL